MYNSNHIVNLEVNMDTISYTKVRQNLASTMEQVCDDHNPLIITSGLHQTY